MGMFPLRNPDFDAYALMYAQQLKENEERKRRDLAQKLALSNMMNQQRQTAQPAQRQEMKSTGGVGNLPTYIENAMDNQRVFGGTNPSMAWKALDAVSKTTGIDPNNLYKGMLQSGQLMQAGGGTPIEESNVPENVLANAGKTGATGEDARISKASTETAYNEFLKGEGAKELIGKQTGMQKELLREKAMLGEEAAGKQFERDVDIEKLKYDHQLAMQEAYLKGYNAKLAGNRVQQIRGQMKYDGGTKDMELKQMMIEEYIASGKSSEEAQKDIDAWYAFKMKQSGSGLSEEEKIKGGN